MEMTMALRLYWLCHGVCVLAESGVDVHRPDTPSRLCCVACCVCSVWTSGVSLLHTRRSEERARGRGGGLSCRLN